MCDAHLCIYAARWFLWKPFINFSVGACGAEFFFFFWVKLNPVFVLCYVSLTSLREENPYKVSLT